MQAIFLARQPIMDRDLTVFGYEILCRSGPEELCKRAEGDQATSIVIDGALHTFGFDAITSGKMAFINVTYNMLVDDLVGLLPKDRTVLEILEDVPIDAGTLAACKHYKEKGYKIALDDFALRPGIEKLIDIADMVKIDYQATDAKTRRKYVDLLRKQKNRIELVAEKVETVGEFHQAKTLGFALYQGFFFSHPEEISSKEIPPYKLNFLHFLREVNRRDVNFDELQEIIKREMSLSVRLLRYINSAMFGLRSKVDSIKRALAYLGEKNIRRWASVLALIEMGDDKPHELIVTALIRARFCELVGKEAGMTDQTANLFLTGMVSTLDAILDQPMDDLLEVLPLSPEIKSSIQEEDGPFSKILSLVKAYEQANWKEVVGYIDAMDVPEDRFPQIYQDALSWTDEIFKNDASK